MDQDVQMNNIAKPKTGDGLDEYNLENYDDDDTAPGIPQSFLLLYGLYLTILQLWVRLVISKA
jgi:hypothetical protein